MIILDIIAWLGIGLLALGAFMDLIAALGINRFKNFYLRLHALTVGVIGGAFYPLIGLGLISIGVKELGTIRFYIAGISFTSAFFVLITAPVGTHILARAAHRIGLRPTPAIVDRLREDREKKVMR